MQRGALMRVKVSNGLVPEVFGVVGGLRLVKMQLQNRALDASHAESGAWRVLAAEAGVKQLMLEGVGSFTDAASEEMVRGFAFAASVNRYQLWFGNGDYVQGAFLITGYTRVGDVLEEEAYSLRLESAGEISFVSA